MSWKYDDYQDYVHRWTNPDKNKATLRLNKNRADAPPAKPYKITQYLDRPLFYGLPTMDQWLKWRAKQIDKLREKE